MIVAWLVLLFLIAVNALYVAIEFAQVATPKSQIASLAEGGNTRAAGLLAILEDGARLDDNIAACQIGITLSSLVAGAFGQATITPKLGPILAGWFQLSDIAALSAAALLVLVLLTALQVILGELVPKSLALQFPERVALATYLPAKWSTSAFRFFIWLLNGSAFLLLKPFGVTPGGGRHIHSPEEIEFLLAASQRGGALSREVHRRLQRGLQLPLRTVRQLMVPRGELEAIEITTPPEVVLQKVLDSPYSRLPVYRETLDKVVGAISTKDVAAAFAATGEMPHLEEMVTPIPFVFENIPADKLVRFLQEQKSSKALVVDEFGGVEGIVSIEDVLMEMFGEVGDELKQGEEGAEPLVDGRVRIPGSLGLDEVERWTSVRWEGTSATVGGHVVEAFGRLPEEGETIEIDGVLVEVERMSPKTVVSVIVTLSGDEGPDGGGEA